MDKKNLKVIAAFILSLILFTSCQIKDNLPCPIPQTQMEAPQENFVAYTIQNDTCTTFCDINIFPRSCDDWGLDWIAGDSLRSGENVTVFLPPGTYDILLEDCTDLEVIIEKQPVDGETGLYLSSTNADSLNDCQASVTVENRQTQPICYMRIATENSESFGGNWLGQEQIVPGESAQFYIMPEKYDLKAEACDFTVMKLEMDRTINEHMIWIVE